MNLQPILKILIAALLFSSCINSETNQNSKEETKNIDRTGIVDVDGYGLKYIRGGRGNPLIVIGSSEYYSKAFSKDLKKRFDLIFIDSRHFVPDCTPKEEELDKIGLSTFSNDLEVIRKHLSLDKFGLIGHSIHAQIAIDYAVNYPNNVEKLIIIGGVPYSFSELGDLQTELWNSEANEERKSISTANNELLKEKIDSIPADRQFAVSYHYNAPQYWANPKYDASRLLDGLRTCPEALGKLFMSVPLKSEVAQKLNRLSVPTIVILGKLDFVIPYKAWEELINDKTNIEYVLMENASHNPHTEESTQPDFDKHLIDWINGLN